MLRAQVAQIRSHEASLLQSPGSLFGGRASGHATSASSSPTNDATSTSSTDSTAPLPKKSRTSTPPPSKRIFDRFKNNKIIETNDPKFYKSKVDQIKELLGFDTIKLIQILRDSDNKEHYLINSHFLAHPDSNNFAIKGTGTHKTIASKNWAEWVNLNNKKTASEKLPLQLADLSNEKLLEHIHARYETPDELANANLTLRLLGSDRQTDEEIDKGYLHTLIEAETTVGTYYFLITFAFDKNCTLLDAPESAPHYERSLGMFFIDMQKKCARLESTLEKESDQNMREDIEARIKENRPPELSVAAQNLLNKSAPEEGRQLPPLDPETAQHIIAISIRTSSELSVEERAEVLEGTAANHSCTRVISSTPAC